MVDATTLDLTNHDVEAGRLAVPDFAGTSSCEIHQCALEIQTPVCRSLDSLLDSVAKMRRVAAQRAHRDGHEVLSAGLHPFADWRTQQLRSNPETHPHYARLLDEYVDVARGAMSFGLHLHFGLSDPRTRIEVMNRLRERLPCVLALSASAPFAQGRDTGMQSWRHAMLDRYPRMGVPGTWKSEADYLTNLERLRRVGVLTADQGMWEDLRLHHRYSTLEVRICDSTPHLERVWLIAALLLCEVHTLDAEVRAGRDSLLLPAALIEENRWRARRHGTKADFIDWRRDELVSSVEHYARWLDRLTPAAASLGILPALSSRLSQALAAGTSADEQRAIVHADGTLQDVVRHLIDATAAPLEGAHEREWV